MHQLSTLLPGSRFDGTSMRVHLAIREDSFGGITTGGRESRESAFGEMLIGYFVIGDIRLRRGAEWRRISRS